MEKDKEILRQQLELLAERSKSCSDELLAQISEAMLKIVIYLDSSFECNTLFNELETIRQERDSDMEDIKRFVDMFIKS